MGELDTIHNGDQPMAEDVPQNPTTSPASDSDSDNEAQQKAELQTLETKLSSNPSNYDAHVQYIKLLRKMGELEKLRQAKEAMSELFLLAPYMWQEWAKDEASLTTRQEIFLSVLLVQLVCMLLKASNYAYRTFEQAIFLTISDSDIQLAIPHVDLKSTLLAYKAWEVEQGKVLDVESSEPDGISSRVTSAYQRALEGYNAHAHHEEKISRQDISYSEKLQQFVICSI
ncbi:Squamous cell carcinoma antigen recognized by T-cells 3 [Fagus crenata]